MSNYSIRTGFWRDYSHDAITGWTLTLPIRQANWLISGSTLAVATSATCVWIIIAYWLHHYIVNSNNTDVLGLQHQVILTVSGSPISFLWNLIKILWAWRKRGVNRLMKRTFVLGGIALFVWLGFTAASIFVSELASQSYRGIGVLLKPNNCGRSLFNSTTDPIVVQGGQTKRLRDAIRAQIYTDSYYNNTPASVSISSLFPVETLPFDSIVNTSCPFDSSICNVAPGGAFSMVTHPLDSHLHFGINAPKANRVQIQRNTTCNLLNDKYYTQTDGLYYYLEYGPVLIYNYTYSNDPVSIINFTYAYDPMLINTTVDYNIS
jgi:hypothetical protein